MPTINAPVPNPLMSGIFRESMHNMMQGSVARFLFPTVRVAKREATYYKWLRENDVNFPILKPRTPGTPYQIGAMSLTTDSYVSLDYGIKMQVTDEERENLAEYLSADRNAVMRGARIIAWNREYRAKTAALASGAATSSPSTKWNQANSTPVADVKAACLSVLTSCGQFPNVMVMSRTVYNVLTENSDIRDRLNVNATQKVTAELLAALFEVQTVAIADSIYNTAAEGQTASLSLLWGEDVVLACTDAADDLQAFSFGKCINWSPFSSGDPNAPLVRTNRDDDVESDFHRLREHCTEKVTSPYAGYIFTNTLN